MTNHEFINRIRSLYNIDRDQLPELLSQENWCAFRDNPPRYLCSTDKAQSDAIIREMEKRQETKMDTVYLEPIETVPKKEGEYILLAGPSGYSTTPLRMEVCSYEPTFRPNNPWQNHSHDAFTDGGAAPTHWMPVPQVKP